MIDRLLQTLNHLRQAQKELARLPVADIVSKLDRWADRWRNPSCPWRKEAAEKSTFPFEMVAPGLDTLLAGLTEKNLWLLLEEEFGDPRVLDEFRPRGTGGMRRAMGYPLAGCVLAGNTPLVSWPPLLSALLVKSACFAKMASDETVWASLLIRSLREAAPELGNCLAADVWPGGSEEIESFLAQQVDLLMVFGSDNAVAAWRSRTSLNKPFLGYGHRASFAVILKECLTPATAEKLAYDVSMYDQQGCLSPQVAYIEVGGEVAPEEFSEWAAGSLEGFARRFPCKRDFAAANAIRRMRDMAAFAEGAHLWGADDLSWTLCLQPPGPFPLSCGYRFLSIVPLQELWELPALLEAVKPSLESAGLAAPPDRQQDTAELLASLGISRICPVGAMQQPPFAWHHEGLPLPGRLVRWRDREV